MPAGAAGLTGAAIGDWACGWWSLQTTGQGLAVQVGTGACTCAVLGSCFSGRGSGAHLRGAGRPVAALRSARIGRQGCAREWALSVFLRRPGLRGSVVRRGLEPAGGGTLVGAMQGAAKCVARRGGMDTLGGDRLFGSAHGACRSPCRAVRFSVGMSGPPSCVGKARAGIAGLPLPAGSWGGHEWGGAGGRAVKRRRRAPPRGPRRSRRPSGP